MSPALRRIWLKLHRWTALSFGWLLALAALLGALLTVAKPLDQWLHPQLFEQAAPGPVSALQQVRGTLDQEFGPGSDYTLRPPRKPGDTLWVYVGGRWEGVVYFDSAGRELGRRGEHEGFYNLLFELHSSLLLGDTGKLLLTTAAGLYLFLLATGLVLWWPRNWPPSLRIQWRAGWLRTAVDLHNVLGAVLGLLIAISVASGTYMAWAPLRTAVTTMLGQAPVAPPNIPAPGPAAVALPLDHLLLKAQAVFPQAMVGYVQVPGRAAQPVRVRLKMPDDPHPNGLSSVWLDPVTGTVLKAVRWNELDPGNRFISTMYPLHTGALGGPAHTVAVALSGLTLAALGATGLFLWWKRRALRRGISMQVLRGIR